MSGRHQGIFITAGPAIGFICLSCGRQDIAAVGAKSKGQMFTCCFYPDKFYTTLTKFNKVWQSVAE